MGWKFGTHAGVGRAQGRVSSLRWSFAVMLLSVVGSLEMMLEEEKRGRTTFLPSEIAHCSSNRQPIVFTVRDGLPFSRTVGPSTAVARVRTSATPVVVVVALNSSRRFRFDLRPHRASSTHTTDRSITRVGSYSYSLPESVAAPTKRHATTTQCSLLSRGIALIDVECRHIRVPVHRSGHGRRRSVETVTLRH